MVASDNKDSFKNYNSTTLFYINVLCDIKEDRVYTSRKHFYVTSDKL